MANFCEGCPMQGRLSGEIYGLAQQEIVTALVQTGGIRRVLDQPLITGRRQGGVLIDEEMNPSMPFWIGALEDVDTVGKKVENCEGPFVTEKEGLFRKPKKEFFCPAIGRLAIKPSDDAYRIIAQGVNL